MCVQQTTFENIVTKGEIALNEQFLLLSQCFNFYSYYTYNHRDFPYFLVDFFKVFCCRFAVCGKGVITNYIRNYVIISITMTTYFPKYELLTDTMVTRRKTSELSSRPLVGRFLHCFILHWQSWRKASTATCHDGHLVEKFPDCCTVLQNFLDSTEIKENRHNISIHFFE